MKSSTKNVNFIKCQGLIEAKTQQKNFINPKEEIVTDEPIWMTTDEDRIFCVVAKV